MPASMKNVSIVFDPQELAMIADYYEKQKGGYCSSKSRDTCKKLKWLAEGGESFGMCVETARTPPV